MTFWFQRPVTAGGSWQLDAAYWEPSNYPLRIIFPVAGLNTNNRAYKAYPGLEYNIRAGVFGGAYPFHFTLTTAPSGMTINEYTGEITWSNPVVSGSPHSVTLQVEDHENTVQTVSWTITVTTSGFYFVDAVNGLTVAQGGTGTLANPWKNISDWYEGTTSGAQTANSYVNGFLYWRTGTYANDIYTDPAADYKSIIDANYKPIVWLAYPGESPIIDLANGWFHIYNGHNQYMDGLDIDCNSNSRGRGILTASSVSNVVVRKCKFHDFAGYAGGTNAGYYIARNAAVKGENFLFQDNEFYDVRSDGYGLLAYEAKYTVAENNYCHDIATHGISAKEGNQYWDIRANYFGDGNDVDAISVQYSDTGGQVSGHIEIRYNRVIPDASGNYIRVNPNQTANGLPVYVYRNTLAGSVAQSNYPTATNGPFYWTKNTIQNNNASCGNGSIIDRVCLYNGNNGDETRFIPSNNLTAASGLVDAAGRLTGANRDTYLYTRGHELPAPYDGDN